MLLFLALTGCTEQYVLQTNTFESAIVVEATITNEFKKQRIKITRTYRLEENYPTNVTDAEVSVTDSDGKEYVFEEAAGSYVSISEFAAIPGKTYRLNIVTNDGKTYNSTAESLTTINPIEAIVPKVQTKNGTRGVFIYVNSQDPQNTSKYYRYEYEETYKIIAPKWNSDKAITVPGETPSDHREIVLQPRGSEETRICYSSERSNGIIQTTTSSQNEDRIDFPVRFISEKNAIISNRYSILVRQYIQNLASYTFYKTLKEISGSENILSQTQPGFFYGNMKSIDNPNEKVIGFFEVSSVSSKRIFFNYEDLFPGQQLPPYFTDCTVKEFKFCFASGVSECKGNELLSAINANTLLYYGNINDRYFMVVPMCGDCTTFSSNTVPSFWE